MSVTGALFKSDGKSGSGNGNIAGILADFLDDAGKLKVYSRSFILRRRPSLSEPAEGGNTTCR
jgi:hypothetical protein